MRKLLHAPEGQEGPEAQFRLGVGIDEGVADEHAVVVVLEDQFLAQLHASHAVERGGHLLAVEFSDVFMSVGAEGLAFVFVQPELEFHAMLDDGRVEGAEKHVVVIVEFGYRYYEQPVILARVAIDDSRAGVGSRPVGA